MTDQGADARIAQIRDRFYTNYYLEPCNLGGGEADVEFLLALVDQSRQQQEAMRHAATLLAKSLTDEMLHSIRIEWGNTNAAVLTHWRAEVLAALARLPDAEAGQIHTCPICGPECRC